MHAHPDNACDDWLFGRECPANGGRGAYASLPGPAVGTVLNCPSADCPFDVQDGVTCHFYGAQDGYLRV